MKPNKEQRAIIGEDAHVLTQETSEQTQPKMNYITRTTQMTVLPEGEPIFSELATVITIIDEAGGEFLEVTQHDSSDGGKITIDDENWPEIRQAIEMMLAYIVMNKTEEEAE